MSIESEEKPQPVESNSERENALAQEAEQLESQKQSYDQGAEQIAAYLKLPPTDRTNPAQAFTSSQLEGVFGEGLPVKYLPLQNYDQYQGMTSLLAPQGDLRATKGMTLVDELKAMHANESAVAASQKLIATYENQSAEIVAKSPTLTKLLAPFERADNDQVTEEEMRQHTKIGGISGNI